MKLIVGLGNPGDKYSNTRHNMGFMVIDSLKKTLKIDNEKNKFQGILSEIIIDGEKILLLKPQTFMNLSGNSVLEVINFYKLDPSKDLIVVYDDLDLPLGYIRIREKGSSGGHNGMKSIISQIGDNFLRIRCGIGKDLGSTVNYVLGKFSLEENEKLNETIKNANECLMKLINNINIEKIMQQYNNKVLRK